VPEWCPKNHLCFPFPVAEFPSDLLEPFAGYFELGMHHEASDELDNLPAKLKMHPVVLGRGNKSPAVTNWRRCSSGSRVLCRCARVRDA
jgi:hypothetical protein